MKMSRGPIRRSSHQLESIALVFLVVLVLLLVASF
jgi:hypothetical protein